MKVIYTAIFGDSDNLKEPYKVTPDWKYVCFTDNPDLRSNVWEIIVVPPEEPRKQSRYYKINNHFPEAEITIWVDATFEIRRDLNLFTLNKTDGIWLNEHPMRQCAYEELEVVKNKGLDSPEFLDSRIAKYREEGFPEQFGLWRCGIIIRNPRNPLVTKLCETWWKEIEEGTWRDQAALSYACWKNGLNPNTIPYGLSQAYFRQSLHKANPTEDWKFVGEGNYDPELTKRYDTAHLIILRNGILFPKWVNNYISLKNGVARFIELVKLLNGTIVLA
jgi:hypothetical protein